MTEEEGWVEQAHATGALVPVDIMSLELRREDVDRARLVSMMGTPRKRESDSKFILIPDPLSSLPVYYEFETKDVVEIEQEIMVSDRKGNSYPLVRAWFREGTLCVRSELVCLSRMDTRNMMP